MREMDYILEIAAWNNIDIDYDKLLSGSDGKMLIVDSMSKHKGGLKFKNEGMYTKWVYLWELFIGKDEGLLRSHIMYLTHYGLL